MDAPIGSLERENSADGQQQQQEKEAPSKRVDAACQTEPNLIDRLLDNSHTRRPTDVVDDNDLYQDYMRSAQSTQFWPLDKNPVRALVPKMLHIDLPEQHLKNESLMFDLVQAITSNSKLVNLLAKYIHHVVPNVIISKRIDLIPLITCTIRVCRDPAEQERLMRLLFNLIKRPNEEQRRMIMSGIIVVLQVSSPQQSSSLLLPNLWDHVNDKFPERRVLLAESCATLAHYVRPVMRTQLILSILIQLLKDKNAAVRSAACKSFACLLTLIMDRNDEVFDACLSAGEDILTDVLQQTPMSFCEHRMELEQMRACALETVFPLLCMWAVKLGRFKCELAQFYLSKAEQYLARLLGAGAPPPTSPESGCASSRESSLDTSRLSVGAADTPSTAVEWAAAALARRRTAFLDSRQSSSFASSSTTSTSSLSLRRQSAVLLPGSAATSAAATPIDHGNGASATTLNAQRAIGAYLKMLNYMVPFVFSDAVHSCAWLTKSSLNRTSNNATPAPADCPSDEQQQQQQQRPASDDACLFGGQPVQYANKLLEPTLIIDEAAVVAFHDQLEREHMVESLGWLLEVYLPKMLAFCGQFSHAKFAHCVGATSDVLQDYMLSCIASTRQLCLLFGKHFTRHKIRPLIKSVQAAAAATDDAAASGQHLGSLHAIYLASLCAFEPIEQQEYEELVVSVRVHLQSSQLTRQDAEILACTIKIIATNSDQVRSPSTRQKFLTYIIDAFVNYSNQTLRCSSSSPANSACSDLNSSLIAQSKTTAKLRAASGAVLSGLARTGVAATAAAAKHGHKQHSQVKEFMLIIFRHILTCLIDPHVRPLDWAHILVSKFLPLLIMLANDATDVYVCTYARLMCAQLVETFDTHLNSPRLTRQTADTLLPALSSLQNLTEQIKASNLKRQIECMLHDLNDKFYRERARSTASSAGSCASISQDLNNNNNNSETVEQSTT